MAEQAVSVMPPSPPTNLRRCCRCNRTAKCVRCACARIQKPCTRCLPGVHDRCQNRDPSTTPTPTPTPTASPQQHSLAAPSQDQRPQVLVPELPTDTSSTTMSSLPSLTTTLQHVPKGARDCWSRALSICLLSVSDNPGDLTHWCKLFMLPKCVLACPAAGHRLPWREILQQVRSRLRRWSTGDLLSLWKEATDNITQCLNVSTRLQLPPLRNVVIMQDGRGELSKMAYTVRQLKL